MVKREKKRKLGGSVLLTVVCVMSLLIIFLFGTLALATAANNRAHVNYSTAQTDVTSRTVVDAAIKAMEANTDFGNAVSNLNTVGGSSGFEVNVQLGDGTEGRYGHIKPVQVKYVGTKKFYDTEKKEWIDGDIVEFLSQVNMAGVESSTAAYIVKQPPDTSDGSGGGGAGFVTTAGAGLSCQTNLYGGTYINLPKLGVAENLKYYYRTVNEYTKWNKDDSANYDPTLYRQFAPYDGTDATAFHLQNSGAFAEADLYVNNNMSIENWSGFIFPEKGKGITIWGDLILGSSRQNYISKLNITEDTEINFNEIPYLYVDGNIRTSQSVDTYIGNLDDPFPLNIFCGSITDNGQYKIAGDVYCMNPTETSKIGGKGADTLYDWVASVVTKTGTYKHTANSIYSKGNLELKNAVIDGDVRVEGNCTISGDVTINGNLVVGKKLTVESGANVNVINKVYGGELDVPEGGNSLFGYKKLSIFDHEGKRSDIVKVVPNIKRSYHKYHCQGSEIYGWAPVDPNGNPILDNQWDIYYKWKEDVDPTVLGEKYYEADFDLAEPYLDLSSYMLQGARPEAAPGDGDHQIEYYYVETDEDGNALSKRVNYKEYGIKEDGTRVYGKDEIHDTSMPSYKTIPRFDGSDSGIVLGSADDIRVDMDNDSYVYYNLATKAIVSEAEAQAEGTVKDISTYPNAIYPEYAERDVIIGDTTLPGVPKSETQIVMKIDEVLNNVTNPYNNVSPPGIDESSGFIKYENIDAIYKDNGKIAFDIKSDGSYILKDITKDGTNQVTVDDAGTQKSISEARKMFGYTVAPVITKSCILNTGLANGDCNALVIDPQGSRICVVIEGDRTISAGIKILVNDDNPGSVVDFYIAKDSKLSMGSGWLGTTKYCKALSEHDGGVIRYNSGTGDPGDLLLENLGKPRVNIYGDTGSELAISNMMFLIGNIVSPELKVTVSATSGEFKYQINGVDVIEPLYSFSNVYYNNVDVNAPTGTDVTTKQFIIGCLNARQADIPNRLNVIYVDDAGGTPPKKGGDPDHAFNYRVLYYDEY